MGMHFRESEDKITIGMIVAGIIIIGILLTSLIVYLLNVNSSKVNDSILQNSQISKLENTDEFEDVSSEIGKSVNEAINENNSNSSLNVTSNTNSESISTNTNTENTSNTKPEDTIKETKTNITDNTNKTSETTAKIDKNNKTEENEEEKNNITFIEPVKGEIIREFAPDSLVYSETLKEWITHNGVDIKADKTSVVVSACDGKVSAIKNDPRYGLTVIIEHDNGYKTVYANLLTAEYVVEGEEVTAGQTIGTVGNSANFEIADDYHLHFEIIKDGEYIDPLQHF